MLSIYCHFLCGWRGGHTRCPRGLLLAVLQDCSCRTQVLGVSLGHRAPAADPEGGNRAWLRPLSRSSCGCCVHSVLSIVHSPRKGGTLGRGQQASPTPTALLHLGVQHPRNSIVRRNPPARAQRVGHLPCTQLTWVRAGPPRGPLSTPGATPDQRARSNPRAWCGAEATTFPTAQALRWGRRAVRAPTRRALNPGSIPA